jgi:DNA-binding SARP family transcriptional activator
MRGAEVRLLGPVELWSGGSAVELGPARQRTVLAALAVDAGRLVPLDVLIDRVWGEDPPSGVRSGIYSYVARLRRVLRPLAARGDHVQLRSRPGGYLLDLDPESVDLHQFRRLTQATRPDQAGPPEVSLLDAALALWRGPALADLAGAWVDATRERLEQQRVDAVLTWAQAHLRAGRPGAVTGTLRDLVTRHPLVEPLAAQAGRPGAGVRRVSSRGLRRAAGRGCGLPGSSCQDR